MGRAEACICCQEIEQVNNKLNEAVTNGEFEEEPTCITQHPGFHPVCINRWVLQSALQRQINFLRFLDRVPATLRCL